MNILYQNAEKNMKTHNNSENFHCLFLFIVSFYCPFPRTASTVLNFDTREGIIKDFCDKPI